MNQNKVDISLPIENRKIFLEYCANLYETTGKSPISDVEYDKEYKALQSLDPEWDIVGGLLEEHVYGTKIKHKVICGSLLKDPDVNTFENSFKSIYNKINLSHHAFLIQYKIDGLAMCCVYNNGNLQSVVTRGRDGIHGIDVTPNGKYIKGIPASISYKGEVEIRGECYKNKFNFYKNWVGEYANPRNFAAGSVNQKNPEVTEKRELNFIAYEVVRKDFSTEEEKLEFLVENNFENLKTSTIIVKNDVSVQKVVSTAKEFMENTNRSELPFEIDGIVVKLNNIETSKLLGTVSGGKKPKANRAIKFPCEQKETEIIGVEYAIGRTGAITIVGILSPVQLAGTTIRRVSLHNFDYVKRNELAIGSHVLLQKSGDIIPYIVRKVKDGDNTLPIQPPQQCPACGGGLKWGKGDTVYCDNPACIAKINKSIEHWLKKIGTVGIGQGIIKKLTDTNELSWDNKVIITKLSDIYWKLDSDNETSNPSKKYEYLKKQLGEKTYENILKSINSVKEMPLDKFIEALGIANIGTMASLVVEIAPTIDDIDKLKEEDLIKIDGFGNIKSKGFIHGWRTNREEISRLLKFIKIVKPVKDSNVLAGKKFCFTGSFSNPTRKEMEQMVIDNGGKKGTVSKDLTALISDGEISGNKIKKAESLNIPIISQKDFLAMI
ncbi:MAG: NAD-dependent DNA ligase LigA [bacterium]